MQPIVAEHMGSRFYEEKGKTLKIDVLDLSLFTSYSLVVLFDCRQLKALMEYISFVEHFQEFNK